MTTTSSDRRRYGVIETRFSQHGQVAVYVLSIGGQTWAQVEWSPSRRAWCIQDASGRCLSHCDAIHGQDVDPQTAVALARRMILDGRMPTPEEAEAQLRERLAAEDAHRLPATMPFASIASPRNSQKSRSSASPIYLDSRGGHHLAGRDNEARISDGTKSTDV